MGNFKIQINRKGAVVVCIALITIVFFGIATDTQSVFAAKQDEGVCSEAEKRALKDLKDSKKWPPACNWSATPPDEASPSNNPTRFLISGCPPDYTTGERVPCYHSVSGIVQIIVTLANFLLGTVGALALLMFVWGGFQWLMSGGEEERVKAGTSTLRNAVIGLLIVFGSWIGVNFIVNTLTGDKGLFGNAANKWYEVNKGAICYRALTEKELACELAEPYQPVAPTAPTAPTCSTLLSGSDIFSLPTGDSCPNVCQKEASKQGKLVARVANAVERKECCCLFGTSAGPGVAPSKSNDGLEGGICLDLGELAGGYGTGVHGCKTTDLKCDTADLSSGSIYGTCKKK